MYQRKPGAATAAEPKFMWIKMLSRKHQHQSLSKAEFFRFKFNLLLEDKLASKEGHYVLDASAIIKHDSFDKSGFLCADDVVAFWDDVDQQIELFDKRKIELIPRVAEKQFQNAHHSHQKAPADRQKLPTPPHQHN